LRFGRSPPRRPANSDSYKNTVPSTPGRLVDLIKCADKYDAPKCTQRCVSMLNTLPASAFDKNDTVRLFQLGIPHLLENCLGVAAETLVKTLCKATSMTSEVREILTTVFGDAVLVANNARLLQLFRTLPAFVRDEWMQSELLTDSEDTVLYVITRGIEDSPAVLKHLRMSQLHILQFMDTSTNSKFMSRVLKLEQPHVNALLTKSIHSDKRRAGFEFPLAYWTNSERAPSDYVCNLSLTFTRREIIDLATGSIRTIRPTIHKGVTYELKLYNDAQGHTALSLMPAFMMGEYQIYFASCLALKCTVYIDGIAHISKGQICRSQSFILSPWLTCLGVEPSSPNFMTALFANGGETQTIMVDNIQLEMF